MSSVDADPEFIPAYPRGDPTAAEPTVQADRENAQQEGKVDPRGGSAPINRAGIPTECDELQDCERRVATAERPDPQKVVLPDPMEGGEADPNEPRADRPPGQGRQGPRPHRPDDGRSGEKARPEREHGASLGEDDDPHPRRRRGPGRWIVSRRAELPRSDEEHGDRDARVD